MSERSNTRRRIVMGIVLLLHGLAHANAGMLAADRQRVFATTLWAIASVCFMAAGAGLLGVRRLGRHWQVLALTASASSLLMLGVYRPMTAVPGIIVDLAIVGVVTAGVVLSREWSRPRTGIWPTVVRTVVFLLLGYVAVAILSRPWHSRWGSTDAELRAALPGDDLVPNPHYTIQHAVTIRATPETIWPWLVQLGQDRGGFYSYDWLERLVGDDIRNADRIHPEWQTLKTGDLVRATQPDYLGGVFGSNLGWRVTRLEPERVLVLGGWGAFVLEPLSDSTTRLIVRTRGAVKPNVALAPVGLLVFEPAHFIMQRRMLLGIQDRAEGQGPAATSLKITRRRTSATAGRSRAS